LYFKNSTYKKYEGNFYGKTAMNFNTFALGIFSALFLLIGAIAFLIPENMPFLSTTYPYNLFRVNIGLIGIIMALFNDKTITKYSNLALGLVITYQAVASLLHIYPDDFFKYTILDNIVNMDIGLAMLLFSLIESD
jgi:hypothetical protein